MSATPRPRRAPLALVAALAVTLALPVAASAVERHVEQGARVAAQLCRVAGAPEDAGTATDSRRLDEAALSAYESSWAHRALRLQAALDDATPLRAALVPGTHNSFNAAAYAPTLSGLDHNQVLSLRDQLRLDMRSLELDVHWFPSPAGRPEDGFHAPLLCHGRSQAAGPATVHAGCTAERPLADGLAEITGWLAEDGHEDEFLVLYLENHLDGDPAAHAAAARALADAFGDDLVETPAVEPCAPMPTASSRAELRPRGRVLLVGNCDPSDPGIAATWGALVHERAQDLGVWSESKSAAGEDFACPAAGYGHTFQRFYEDSTWLSHTVEPTGQGSPGEITVAETAAMVRCGVNLFGFDQLHPADDRLAALVWSWAPDEPSGGRRAAQGPDGRFHAVPPNEARPWACLDAAAGSWHVTAAAGRWDGGVAACTAEFPGTRFSVPATAAANEALAAARGAAPSVWVDYAKVSGEWTPEAS